MILDTPPIQPFSAIGKVGADARAADGDQLTVRVYYQGRPVKVDVAMSSASADYAGTPKQSEGADGVSAPIAPGDLKALAVFVPLPSGARWHSVDVSKSDITARALRIDLELPESASRTPLHMTLYCAPMARWWPRRAGANCAMRKSSVYAHGHKHIPVNPASPRVNAVSS